MGVWLTSFWQHLRTFRPMAVMGTAVSGIAIGVLGSGAYDCIKLLGQEVQPPAHVARRVIDEGYEITLLGRPAMLIMEGSNATVAQSFAVQAAFGTKGPPYQVYRTSNTLRIFQVNVVDRNEDPSFSSPGCWHTYLVVVTGAISGPDFESGAVSGKVERCADEKDRKASPLEDFVNEVLISAAVNKLRSGLLANRGGGAAKASQIGAQAAESDAKKSDPVLFKCLPCWLWERACNAVQ